MTSEKWEDPRMTRVSKRTRVVRFFESRTPALPFFFSFFFEGRLEVGNKVTKSTVVYLE